MYFSQHICRFARIGECFIGRRFRLIGSQLLGNAPDGLGNSHWRYDQRLSHVEEREVKEAGPVYVVDEL
eukprot:6310643-Prymnesium_polylepis.1